MFTKLMLPFAAVLMLGCASTVPDPTTSSSTRQSNVLSADEIMTTHADVNSAYDAIQRLRPNWLVPHGVTTSNMGQAGATQYPTVFVDGQRYGDLNTLRSIPAYHIGSITYYDVTQAGGRFGIQGGGSGVIEVMTKTSGQ
jgi:hypothetical protein